MPGRTVNRTRCAIVWSSTATVRLARAVIREWIRWDSLLKTLTHWGNGGPRPGEQVDASATLPDGAAFEGVAGLRKLLVRHKDDFVRTLTEKLLAYSVGRGIEYYDLPAIRQIARESAAADNRWSSLILGVIRSRPFSMGIVKEKTE